MPTHRVDAVGVKSIFHCTVKGIYDSAGGITRDQGRFWNVTTSITGPESKNTVHHGRGLANWHIEILKVRVSGYIALI